MGIRKSILMLVCALSLTAGAQTVNLTATNTRTLGGALFTGKLCMVPANNAGAVIGFTYGGGGQGVTKQVCWSVNAGILQGGVTVPDTTLTNPQNLCLYATLIDPSEPPAKQLVRTLPCIQPGAPQGSGDSAHAWCTTSAGVTTCNLDGYSANQGSLVVQQTGPMGPQGPPGPAGSIGGVDMNVLAGGSDFGVRLLSCMMNVDTTYGGICEGRTLGASTMTWASNLTISRANTVINLPCATINMAGRLIIAPGTRNVTIHGCAYQGGSNASGTAGGTVLSYTGTGAAIQVGDTTYAQDTKGFHMDNVNLVTASAGTSAKGFAFYRTQEIDLRNVYLNGNQALGQVGIYLDGTGNYTGGTFDSDTLNGFGTGVYMTGHLSGSVIGDYANAATFTRLHINCPTSGGSPVAGTYGVDIAAGDGNTWSGGDIESCDTVMHLGAHAVNNTVDGLRNENSNYQYVADSGSSYNAVFTGGTFFTGQLVDNGSRNSFWDAFHRTVNGMKGDWYASQQDNTVTNHYRLGIGTGNLRGLQWESAVDQGTSANINNWEWGLWDNAAGWFFQDLINNVVRLSMGVNGITPGGNAQSAFNSAGTGAVILNGATNSGTGGVVFGSGGASPSTVGTLDSSGNFTHYGYHRFFDPGTGTEAWRFNCAALGSCAIDSWGGGSSAHHLRMYQGGGTDIESEGTAPVTINNSSNSGTGGFKAYLGGTAYNVLGFYVGNNAGVPIYQMPGVKSSSGYTCLHADNSGWVSATGTDCGSGTGTGTVTSVGLSVPADESVSGSPVTGSGTLAITRNAQAANTVLAGPTSGGNATPAYRALVSADIPNNAANTTGNAATATKLSANTLGCLDGWDHLPCTVYVQSNVSESAQSGSYATVYTTTAAGVYRINGYTYGTSCGTTSSGSYTATQYVKVQQNGGPAGYGYSVSSAQVGSTGAACSSGTNTSVVANLASGAAIQTETLTTGTLSSGTPTWSRAVQIERIQ